MTAWRYYTIIFSTRFYDTSIHLPYANHAAEGATVCHRTTERHSWFFRNLGDIGDTVRLLALLIFPLQKMGCDIVISMSTVERDNRRDNLTNEMTNDDTGK